jgi:ATP-binding cassette subfamily B protein
VNLLSKIKYRFVMSRHPSQVSFLDASFVSMTKRFKVKNLIALNSLKSMILKKATDMGFVLQQDSSDCGVACLRSLLKYYGSDASLERLRELSGTTPQGTTLLGLYQAANALGLEAEGCEADLPALIEHNQPTILHVMLEGNLEHYVVWYCPQPPKGALITPPSGVRGAGLLHLIGDPAVGLVTWTTEELEKVWVSHKCLTVKPKADLVKVQSQQQAKKAWILKLLHDDWGLLATASLLGLFMAILGMVMALFSQKLIDDILPSKQFTKLYGGLALVTFLLLVKVGIESLRSYILLRQSNIFNNRMVGGFYDTLLALPKSFFDARKIGDLIARLNDTARIQRVIGQLAGSVLIDVLMVLVSSGFLLFYSWKVALGIIAFMPVYFWLLYRFNKPITTQQRSVMAAYSQSESNYINTLQGIRVIKNFSKQGVFSEVNRTIYGMFQENLFQLGKTQIRLNIWASVLGILILIGTLAVTSYQVLQGQLKTGELMAVLGMASSLLPSVANLALIAIPLNEAKIAFERMFEFVGLSPERIDGSVINSFESIEIKNLTFRFAGRKPLLTNINLSLRCGEVVGIMGESGSGKTTLLQIIEKFYTPESAEIMVNKTMNWQELSIESWRSLVTVVPQEVHIFNGTLLDNILLGEISTESMIVDFCKKYNFEAFIDSLPQGMATIVGEEGVKLSGGQKQMLAFMRALFKIDASGKSQLLILDEATSAMDKNTERFVLELLTTLRYKMAILSISHRTDVLQRYCDRVYELENGELSEGRYCKIP